LQRCHVTILPHNSGNVTTTQCGPTFKAKRSQIQSITLDRIKTHSLNASHTSCTRAQGTTLPVETGSVYQQAFEVRHGRSRFGPVWTNVKDPQGDYHPCAYSAVAMAEAAATWWIQEYKNDIGKCLFGRVVAERLRRSDEADGTVRHAWRAKLPQSLVRRGTTPHWTKVCLLAQHVPKDLPSHSKGLRELQIRYRGTCSVCEAAVQHDQTVPLEDDECMKMNQSGFWLAMDLADVRRTDDIERSCKCANNTKLQPTHFLPPLLIYHHKEGLHLVLGDARYAAVAMVFGNNRHFVTLALCPTSRTWICADDQNPNWPESVVPIKPGPRYTFQYSIMVLDTTRSWVPIPQRTVSRTSMGCNRAARKKHNTRSKAAIVVGEDEDEDDC
jgi:hypothetical protein